MARSSRRSEPGAVRRLLLGARPAIGDLFRGYDIPGEDASDLLRDTVELLIVYCGRIEDPRHFFLQALEDSCTAYVERRRAAEEEQDDGTPEA